MSGVRKAVTVHVPTVNDRLKDFDALFSLWQFTNGDNLDVTFDFSQCHFLRQNAVAFLGGLARLIKSRGGSANFLFETLEPKVFDNLLEKGFPQAFGYISDQWKGNSIPYREDKVERKDELVAYLKGLWLGRGWVKVSELLANEIAGTVWEIYANAFQHGKSPIGIISSGQYYPKWRELHLTIVDFGVGIPSNVRSYLNHINMPADKAIEWAMRDANTTKPRTAGPPGGIGLGLLKEFVKINAGYLEIFSHDGYLYINKDRETFLARETFFEGTLVTIKLKCDKRYYLLSSEVEKETKS